MAQHRLSRGTLVPAVFFLLVVTLAFAPVASASPTPPPSGDWTIEAAEDITLTGEDLTLPGGVYVYGHLTLNDCTLRFAPTASYDKPLWVEGRVDAVGTTFTSTTDSQAYFTARASGEVNLTSCEFSHVYAEFTDSSTNTMQQSFTASLDYQLNLEGSSTNSATDCEFTKQGWCGTKGGSHNTFTDCRFKGWCHFASPSHNVLTGCEYIAESPAHSDNGHTVLGLYEDTAVTLSGLLPGYHASTVIQADNNAFHFELQDTSVECFHIRAYDETQLTVENSQIWKFLCANRAATVLTDSEIWLFHVEFQAHWYSGPVNVWVQGFRDGVPQTTNPLAADPTTRAWVKEEPAGPFSITLNNTTITGYSNWNCGDGAPSDLPSTNFITDSTVGSVRVAQDSSLTVTNCTVTYGPGIQSGRDPDATAQLTMEDCSSPFGAMALDGLAVHATLRRCDFTGRIQFRNTSYDMCDPPALSSPTLVLDSVSLKPGYLPEVCVDPLVSGARISGDVDIHPLYHVAWWKPGCTVIRSYPVLVRDPDGAPVVGAPVRLADVYGTVVWSGTTDAEGYAYPEATFDDTNHSTEFRVAAWASGGVDSAALGFFTSTPVKLCPGLHPVSHTSFEKERYPWTAFAAGLGEAATWRQRANVVTWRPGVIAPAAHSGDYLVYSDVAGEGITGLRLDLPVTPSWPLDTTLRTWVNLGQRAGTASTFFGFRFAEDYPVPSGAWAADLGWEVLSATESRFRLCGVSQPTPAGLPADGWHLVSVNYDRSDNTLRVWLDGVSMGTLAAPAAGGEMPHYAVLGASGAGGGASQRVSFDDVSVRFEGQVAEGLPDRLFAGLKGPEKVVDGHSSEYTARYGNGYPVLGAAPSAGDSASALYVGLTLPAGYQLLLNTCTPSAARSGAGWAVWDVGVPFAGEENYIYFQAVSPTGAISGYAGDFAVWQTTEVAAGESDPPDTWGTPPDLLPQYVVTSADWLPDLSAKKTGPDTAAPGDSVSYVVTVINHGHTAAEDIIVKDLLPSYLGGGDVIMTTLPELAPGDLWQGMLTRTLQWGIPGDTLVLNRAYVPSGAPELDPYNNIGRAYTTIVAAHDPNAMYVSPEGGVSRGDTLTYTIECENYGLGNAYGCYAVASLDLLLDEDTLVLGAGLHYDPKTRTLLWEIGTLAPGAGKQVSYTVQVEDHAPRARAIVGQATIYFPSVPEETPTNVVVNVVGGSFGDLVWDFWALPHVEVVYEHGTVRGYGDGSYRPNVPVNRAQMAVFVARALAGGDYDIPDGPAIPTFTDVDTDYWAYKYIEYTVSHGVVAGYDDDTYRPVLAVNRAQMAVFIARALAGGEGAVPAGPATPSFADVSNTGYGPTGTDPFWAYDHVEYIVSLGVVGGYEDGTYRPAVTCTRGQMAVFIARAFQLPT